MAVQLFEHNQRACRAVETMLSQVGKAAVIHSTGTGKIKLIENHPQARFLWLSPNDYIFKPQNESLRRSDPELLLDTAGIGDRVRKKLGSIGMTDYLLGSCAAWAER